MAATITYRSGASRRLVVPVDTQEPAARIADRCYDEDETLIRAIDVYFISFGQTGEETAAAV